MREAKKEKQWRRWYVYWVVVKIKVWIIYIIIILKLGGSEKCVSMHKLKDYSINLWAQMGIRKWWIYQVKIVGQHYNI